MLERWFHKGCLAGLTAVLGITSVGCGDEVGAEPDGPAAGGKADEIGDQAAVELLEETFGVDDLDRQDARDRLAGLFVLSSRGYHAVLPPSAYVKSWDADRLERIADEAEQADRLRFRSRVAPQLSHAGSAQVERTFSELADALGDDSIRRADVIAAADAALAAAEERFGVTFLWTKKGGFRPEIFAVPVEREHLAKIYALFDPANRFEVPVHADGTVCDPADSDADNADCTKVRFSDRELDAMETYGMSEGAVYEARALRLATMAFEMQADAFADDVGSWLGNIPNPFDDRETIVCTDESMTMTLFIAHLEEQGVLRHFRLDGGRLMQRFTTLAFFGHEFRKPLSDHFGVSLLGDGRRRFVLDSWIEDGSQPSNFVGVDAWLAQEESGHDLVELPLDPMAWFENTPPLTAEQVSGNLDVAITQTEPLPVGDVPDGVSEMLAKEIRMEGLAVMALGNLSLPSFLQYDLIDAEILEDYAEWFGDDDRRIEERWNRATVLGQTWSASVAEDYQKAADLFAAQDLTLTAGTFRKAATRALVVLPEVNPAFAGTASAIPWIDTDHQLRIAPLSADEVTALNRSDREDVLRTLGEIIPVLSEAPGSFAAAASTLVALDYLQSEAIVSQDGRLATVDGESTYGIVLGGPNLGQVLIPDADGGALVDIAEADVRTPPRTED